MTRAITNKYFAGCKQSIAEIYWLHLHYLSFPLSSRMEALQGLWHFVRPASTKFSSLEVPLLVFLIS